ncbi:glycine N-acyltransferase-like protein 3 [Mugil cephalus]|uniref:glycine N-acyltransferase-like protein 3 n=1 Tax=Mugil cephalus TaxID=48193 RepID=UPI001FB5F60E|nr:glycine N-acyltransferase-like protein 3 [Mugil cephalus]
MKVLNKDELQIAEGVLQKHFPKSYKTYGFIYGINRNKPTTLEVVVDTWPDFKVIICRPNLKNKRAALFTNKVSYYSMDDRALEKMLKEGDAFLWSTNFCVGGLDTAHLPMLKEASSHRKVTYRAYTLVHLLYLPDPNHLLMPSIDSELESRISCLNLSHVELVNKTWKFGGNEKSYNIIENLISNFLTCCIMNDKGEPVSWILLYDYCAMGILYTLPEHRHKGYAKVLIGTMAKKLYAEGYPLYCYIEEDNTVSYKLFKSMGFFEDVNYRAAWYEFNV